MFATVFAVVLALRLAECIISTGNADVKKEDNLPGESIARGFTYGDEAHLGHLGHLGYGTGAAHGHGVAYSHYGFDAGKYYGYDDGYKHEDEHEPEHEHKHHHDPAYYKALAIKGLLIPLAGVALLGAAAAFVSNPILLQLGVISSTYGRRRRREVRNLTTPLVFGDDEDSTRKKLRDIRLLERFMAQIPREEMVLRERKLFAKYLTCSGVTSDGFCLERLACELHSSEGAKMPVETRVMTIITNEILGNGFVPEGVRSRIARAVLRGKGGRDCREYRCDRLSELIASREA